MKTKQLATAIYGLMAIGAGIWRHLQTGEAQQAIWFGVAMGSLAIVGALLLGLRNRLPGYLLIVVSLCFVGGWFLRRMVSGHADGTSARTILMLVACLIEACVLAWPSPRKERTGTAIPGEEKAV